MPGHIVLLGDSVFDNAAYVGPGEKDVSAHLRQHFAGDSGSIELAAVDGAVITSVERQLASARISDPCLLVLSVGGNDLLGHSYLLEGVERRSFGETMLLLRGIRADFERAYRGALDLITRHEQPTVVCTIYNPQFSDRDLRHAGEVVVSVFNDFTEVKAYSPRDLVFAHAGTYCIFTIILEWW